MADDRPPGRLEGDSDVLGSLPRTRPARRSPKRDGAGTRTAKTQAARARPASRRRTSAAAGDEPLPARRSVPPAGYATPAPERRPAPGTGELVTTAARAAGEVAQLGAGIGRRLLQAAVGRLSGGR